MSPVLQPGEVNARGAARRDAVHLGAPSFEAHWSRADNTASRCRQSLICSSRERKKSGVLVVKSYRNQTSELSNPGDLIRKSHAAKLVFMRAAATFQGHLLRRTVLRELASMAAALRGIDKLMFTGGIGEYAAALRARGVAGVAWIRPVDVPVLRTNEQAVIAGPRQRT